MPKHLRFGLIPGRSPLLGESHFVFFSCRYLDVSVPCVCLPYGIICLQHIGLTHSEICGSKVICTYPQLFAAYHVLHRLWEPRHPPYALNYLLLTYFSLPGNFSSKTSPISRCCYCNYFVTMLWNIFSISFQYVKELCPCEGLGGE